MKTTLDFLGEVTTSPRGAALGVEPSSKHGLPLGPRYGRPTWWAWYGALLLLATQAEAASPYPLSKRITGIHWDLGSYQWGVPTATSGR
jgi:hypothetical protein